VALHSFELVPILMEMKKYGYRLQEKGVSLWKGLCVTSVMENQIVYAQNVEAAA
jgi:hypothetical protein